MALDHLGGGPMTDPHDAASGGFTVQRRLPAPPERVHVAFTEPEKLEQWFVVPGFSTPAERMSVDARTGGRMDAVMIADTDGSEIPFWFTYDEVDAPHRVSLRFEEPAELVTITCTEDGDGTDLTYRFQSWPAPADEAASRAGVERMLDLIEAAIGRGTI
jgi:uncharacterized protein YndB with AHSA1/START domain